MLKLAKYLIVLQMQLQNNNCSASSITNCCKGRIKTVYSYHWTYYEERNYKLVNAHPFVRFEPRGCKNEPPFWAQWFQMNPPKSQ